MKNKLFSKKDFKKATPIEEHGGFLVKRDDRYTINGVSGGKVRGCWRLAQGAKGLITASSRSSPQAVIVARVGQRLGIPVRCHMPTGKETPEMTLAKDAGAEIVGDPQGYNNVIIARAESDFGKRQGWVHIPFGMEHRNAIAGTAGSVDNIVPLIKDGTIKRIVVPVGSGISLCGIMYGLQAHGLEKTPILGVSVGACPKKRLRNYAPCMYECFFDVTIIQAGMDYKTACPDSLGELPLDPIYEAKCVKFLEKGDLFWVVGIRPSTVEDYFNSK